MPPDILVIDAVLPLIDGLGVVDKMKEMFGQRMPRVIGGCMMPFAQEGFMRRGVMTLVRVPWEENQLAAALEEMIVKAREEIDWRSLASVCRRAGQMLEGMGMKPTLRGVRVSDSGGGIGVEGRIQNVCRRGEAL